VIAVVFLAGCKVDPPDGDTMEGPDAAPNLMKPVVDAIGETSLGTVKIEGRADNANRVVVKNAVTEMASVNSLLPGGEFCVDVPLEEGTTNTFEVIAVAEDGNISHPTEVEVVQDNSAPAPADPTCSDAPVCEPTESCDNGIDDDCNGYEDECDSACNGCTDDALEPNDVPFEVPMVTPGDYNELKICPCRIDWYAFDVAANGTINVDVNFDVGEVDIDLKLYTVENAETHVEPAEASSTGTTGTESIDYTSTSGGRYYLKVFSFPEGGDRAGTYRMSID
jgi:hypothetical protein